jgi:hypothetical protein
VIGQVVDTIFPLLRRRKKIKCYYRRETGKDSEKIMTRIKNIRFYEPNNMGIS